MTQEEWVDAMFVGIEDHDCSRAQKALEQAQALGPLKHAGALSKQLAAACPSGLGRLEGRRGHRGRKGWSVKVKARGRSRRRAGGVDSSSPAWPWWVYGVGYSTLALLGIRMLKSRGALSGLGH